ncbi:hypothetical protein BN871_JL_00130 [Paenibacillus sp. P22]|nr:hypothetical protein BN871_JL_00130 [Paenibacillus sp. P22]
MEDRFTSPSLTPSCSLLRDATSSDVAEDCSATALTLPIASLSCACVSSSVMIASVTPSRLLARSAILVCTSRKIPFASRTDPICSWKIGCASDSTDTVSSISRWIVSVMPSTTLIDSRDCSASCRISPATTMNPLPAAPARAASIDAFSDRMFVCFATLPSTSSILRIERVLSFSRSTFSAIPRTMPSARPVWSISAAIWPVPCAPAASISPAAAIMPSLDSFTRRMLSSMPVVRSLPFSASIARLVAPPAISSVAARDFPRRSGRPAGRLPDLSRSRQHMLRAFPRLLHEAGDLLHHLIEA